MLLLIACQPPADPAPDGAVADTTPTVTGDTATYEAPPDDLHGTVPDEAIAAPEFVATSQHGELRDRDALLGHPTVMWFYPAAGTAG
ncbi:MAG: hypothetical protein ACOZNI_12010 [Myxococcota bacterium]